MKNTWKEMRSPLCTGRYVVESLMAESIRCTAARQIRKNSPPMLFAMEVLLQQLGVVLLNATYTTVPDGQGHADAVRRNVAADWQDCNGHLLETLVYQHQPLIIVCGSDAGPVIAKMIRRIPLAEVLDVVHPDARSTLGAYRKWWRHWDIGKLRRFL